MKRGIFIAALALAGCGFQTAVTQDGGLYVPRGTTWEVLRDSLAGRVGDPQMVGGDDEPRAGYYRLRKGQTYRELGRMFERGWQEPVRVTFNNQHTLPQLAGRVAQQLEVDSAAMAEVLLADTTAARYGFDSQTFIAMFVPDTYEFYWTTTPAGFVDRMYGQWEKFWTPEREERLAATGLSRVEAVTLASIVYEETKAADEMATVAGVYINRLEKGIRLQADPTVKFAVGDPTIKRVRERHLAVDSPYNTYMYAGLPPGPIAMPSVAAVDGVLNYQKHKYLYFTAKPDFSGRHNFEATLAEHNRNAAAYHRALSAAGIY
jgi:UPF0755 protein